LQNQPAQTQATTPLSPERLAEIRARVEAVTPGPWGSHRDLDGVYTVQARPRLIPSEGNVSDGDIALVYTSAGDGQAYANARFIAEAPTNVRALLDDVERQAREIERLAADRAATLAEAIDAARAEYLTDNTGTPEDEAYNQGVTDAIAAIGKLLEGGAR
jgi:hypothetical protein